jgi:hypothetical protein
MHIGYKEKYTKEIMNTKFLGLPTDNHIIWKNHNDLLIPTLIEACYAVRSMDHIRNTNSFTSIYYAYFHSIVKYVIIFWVTLATVGRLLFYKRKLSALRLVHNPQPRVEVYFNS